MNGGATVGKYERQYSLFFTLFNIILRPVEWLSGIHAAPLSVAKSVWSNTGDPGIDPAADDFLDQ